jgi:bifunctional DNA-binding transcriptional regulator/antitoxin component of YhaV-PrlF toxin-antitoxin module
MPSVIGQRGQIVIEKPIRDALGLEPGYVAVQILVNDHVELHFYPPEHRDSLRGLLAEDVKQSVAPEQWQKMRQAAWYEAINAHWNEGETTGD